MKEAYDNYKLAREYVLGLPNTSKRYLDVAGDKSNYWRDEVDRMDYMLDATPQIIKRLRHHCHLLTGIKPYEYRNNRVEARLIFQNELEAIS